MFIIFENLPKQDGELEFGERRSTCGVDISEYNDEKGHDKPETSIFILDLSS